MNRRASSASVDNACKINRGKVLDLHIIMLLDS